ncbi:rRNA pseudouridine synthase [Desulfosarcina sp. OttesenSCG-928-A07]|nr:rRNA pseudouridine synthase [Desulfosarcina sp. OttesenSCG-928-G17]MDL2328160.1 rRNA pseudouridine synthase [Desulfosarcina sp. OttesenSCG-928-A07]
MTQVRLQKYLSQVGACSRRQGEAFILAGRVTVNGRPVTTLGTRIDPETDAVCLDGARVSLPEDHLYIMLNKPVGVVTSCRHRGEPVVTDLIDLPRRLFPVGRLDKDSTGLLLMTSDGRIHHQLLHPRFDHEKTYEVTVRYPIDDASLDQMAVGILLDGTLTRPATIQRLSARRFRMVLMEGRNRQIRRMVQAVGNRVDRLNRIEMAGLSLGDLRPGKWRYLTEKEVRRLRTRAGLQS